ncbi:MAG: sigma-70 family RNA polymerase sigma factor [Acidimicrobiales bacterium]|nr:sigma-70 family RNA polymerase sigma factor [Acidimicrobiales bacterium]
MERPTPTEAPLSLAQNQGFEDFFRREFVGLVALAEAVSGDPAAAEDLASEAMSRAHRSWPKISGYDKPGAWARRVTINLAHSRRRKRKRRDAFVRSHRADQLVIAAPQADHPVWAAVATLPDRQRAAIALHYLEDLPVAEIAHILEISVSTATSHLHNARTNLAELLAEGSNR